MGDGNPYFLRITDKMPLSIRSERGKFFLSFIDRKDREGKINMEGKVRLESIQIVAPLPVVLVGCAHSELGSNLLTVAWTGVACSGPPKLHISIRPERHSHRMVSDSRCFTVNLPTLGMLEQVDLCGNISGRHCDKWKLANLTPVPGSVVEAPIVAQCPINYECVVENVLPLGTHDVFVGRIVAEHADCNILSHEGKLDLSRLQPVIYMLGEYWSIGSNVGRYGFSRSARK